MYHIDDRGDVKFCVNEWDCDAPSNHFSSEAEALDNMAKILALSKA